MADTNDVIKFYSELADDFFLDILVLKQVDPINFSAPFLHAHCLELSGKTAALKLNVNYSKKGHEIMELYNILSATIPEISSLLPTAQDFLDYKQLWIKEADVSKGVEFPEENFSKLELAYFIENIKDLKYGFNKKHEAISALHVFSKSFNTDFGKLYNTCRKQYSSKELDTRLIEKLKKAFNSATNIENELKKLIDLS